MEMWLGTNRAVAAINPPCASVEALAQIPGLSALSLLINSWMFHLLNSIELSSISEDSNIISPNLWKGFPDSSVGKESACNAGDPGLIPVSARSSGEGIGYPLQHSWTSLVAQLVKNTPAMTETRFWSLDWDNPLEKGKATHSNTLAWRIQWTIVHGVAKSWTQLATFTFTFFTSLRKFPGL